MSSGTPFEFPLDPSTDLSICIVNTNNRQLLRGCLRSIHGQDHGVCFEVIVVDNASTDGSVEMIAAEFPAVQVIAGTVRRSYAANNNLAIRRSCGRYVMLLNDDTEVMPGALRAHVRYLDEHPEAGVTGGRTHLPDGRVQLGCARLLPRLEFDVYDLLHLSTWWPTHRRLGAYCFGWWDHSSVRRIELPIEANMVLRREVIERVGLMDEAFNVVFGEGPDWLRRIRDAGYTVMFLPEADVLHYGGQTMGRARQGSIYRYRDNSWRYYRKHDGRPKAEVFRLLVLITQTIMVGVYLLRTPFKKDDAGYLRNGLRESWTGIRWSLGLKPR